MRFSFIDNLKTKARNIKSEITVLVIVYKDKRTPMLPKLVMAVTIGYMLSPIDLIPDFIPVLGLLDDLIILPLLIRLSIKLIPTELLADARQQVNKQSQESQKSNWLAAIIILILWIVIIATVTKSYLT